MSVRVKKKFNDPLKGMHFILAADSLV